MPPEANIELNTENTNLERILDSAQDAAFALDRAGKVIFWNPQSVRIFGYTQSEALSKDLSKLIIPEQYRRFFKKQISRFETRGDGPFYDRRLQLRCQRKKGEIFYAEATTSPFILNGTVIGMSCFFRDITQRREAAKTNKKLTGELKIQ